MSGKAPRMSLRDFKQAARAKLAGSDPSSDVVVAPAHTTASRNRPPVTVFEQYVTLIDAEGNEYVVPQAILLASQTLRRLWRSRHKFAEHHQRVIRLDHLSGRIVEHVIKYCFQFYLESYAVFQPLDAAEPEHQSDIKVEPIPEVKIDSLDSLDSLDGGLDEPSTQSDLHDTDSVADVPEPPFVLPAIAIQFPLPPEDAYQVFLAAHYLNIPPLLRLAAAYCAQFVHQLDASALQLLNTELALEILKHLSPDSLLKFEMNHDLATLGIDTSSLWVHLLSNALAEHSANAVEFESLDLSPLDHARSAYINGRLINLAAPMCSDSIFRFDVEQPAPIASPTSATSSVSVVVDSVIRDENFDELVDRTTEDTETQTITTFGMVANARRVAYTVCISPKKPKASMSPVASPTKSAVRRSLLGSPSSPSRLELPAAAASLESLSLDATSANNEAAVPALHGASGPPDAVSDGSTEQAAAAFASFARDFAKFLKFHSCPPPAALRAASFSLSGYLELMPNLVCLQLARHPLDVASAHTLAAFLRQPHCAVKTLVLTECSLSTEHALILASSLRRENDACEKDSASKVETVILSHNSISLVGLAALLTCPSVTNLDLCNNSIGGCKLPVHLLNMIRDSCKVQVLKLSNNRLQSASPISKWERQLCRNPDAPIVWSEIVQAMHDAASGTHSVADAYELFVSSPRKNILTALPTHALQRLELDGNSLTEVEITQCVGLKRLSLACNDMTFPTLEVLCTRIFPNLINLEELDLSGNLFDSLLPLAALCRRHVLSRLRLISVVQIQMLVVTMQRFIGAIVRAESEAREAHAQLFRSTANHDEVEPVQWSVRELHLSRAAYRVELQPVLANAVLTNIVFK